MRSEQDEIRQLVFLAVQTARIAQVCALVSVAMNILLLAILLMRRA